MFVQEHQLYFINNSIKIKLELWYAVAVGTFLQKS